MTTVFFKLNFYRNCVGGNKPLFSDRYIAVCHPIRARKIRTKTYGWLLASVAWLFSLGLSSQGSYIQDSIDEDLTDEDLTRKIVRYLTTDHCSINSSMIAKVRTTIVIRTSDIDVLKIYDR